MTLPVGYYLVGKLFPEKRLEFGDFMMFSILVFIWPITVFAYFKDKYEKWEFYIRTTGGVVNVNEGEFVVCFCPKHHTEGWLSDSDTKISRNEAEVFEILISWKCKIINEFK